MSKKIDHGPLTVELFGDGGVQVSLNGMVIADFEVRGGYTSNGVHAKEDHIGMAAWNIDNPDASLWLHWLSDGLLVATDYHPPNFTAGREPVSNEHTWKFSNEEV